MQAWEGDVNAVDPMTQEDQWHMDQVEEYLALCAVNDQVAMDTREIGEPGTDYE